MTRLQSLTKLLFALIFLSITEPSQGRTKKALIIGNGDYERIPRLTDPLNDVDLMTSIFEDKLDFRVYPYKNLTGERQKAAFDLFKSQVEKGDEIVIFYSGHGVQVNRENFILPVDLNVKFTSELIAQSVSLEALLADAKESGASLSVIFLDSCRTDAEFLEDDTRGNAKSAFAVQNGTAQKHARRIQDVLTCYATEQGTPAFEGRGLYSTYTQALSEEITIAGQPLLRSLMNVQKKVWDRSKGEQKPFFEGSLGDNIVWIQGAAHPTLVASNNLPIHNPVSTVNWGYTNTVSPPIGPKLTVNYTGSEGLSIRDSRQFNNQNLHGMLFQQSELPLIQIGEPVEDGGKTWVYMEVKGWVSTRSKTKNFLIRTGNNHWKVTWNRADDLVSMRTGPAASRRLVSKLAYATVVEELDSAMNGDNHYIFAKFSGWSVMRSNHSTYLRQIH